MGLQQVGEPEFAREVLAATEPVLVDFTAGWCPPCQELEPVLEALEDVRVVQVDVDENPVVADLYRVTAMPTLVLFRAGQEVTRLTGVKSREQILERIAPDRPAS